LNITDGEKDCNECGNSKYPIEEDCEEHAPRHIDGRVLDLLR
jgi:hypothetical protein